MRRRSGSGELGWWRYGAPWSHSYVAAAGSAAYVAAAGSPRESPREDSLGGGLGWRQLKVCTVERDVEGICVASPSSRALGTLDSMARETLGCCRWFRSGCIRRRRGVLVLTEGLRGHKCFDDSGQDSAEDSDQDSAQDSHQDSAGGHNEQSTCNVRILSERSPFLLPVPSSGEKHVRLVRGLLVCSEIRNTFGFIFRKSGIHSDSGKAESTLSRPDTGPRSSRQREPRAAPPIWRSCARPFAIPPPPLIGPGRFLPSGQWPWPSRCGVTLPLHIVRGPPRRRDGGLFKSSGRAREGWCTARPAARARRKRRGCPMLWRLPKCFAAAAGGRAAVSRRLQHASAPQATSAGCR